MAETLSEPPRIWLSNPTPAPGEIVTVRTMIAHPMETGLRRTPDGEVVPQHIISHFECRLGEDLLFTWEPGTAVAESPYLEFRFAARGSGALRMVWVDDRGARAEAVEEIDVAG